MTREGVIGLEYNKWSDRCTPRHQLIIPYIRQWAGPMDYTPGAMLNAQPDQFRINNVEPMSQGTRCHQLAMYVVYESPLQMLSDSPTKYDANKECLEFLKEVPSVWDETVPLWGKIGEDIAVARRSGDKWFVGAMSAGQEKDAVISLDFLPEGTYSVTVYKDGINAAKNAKDYCKETLVLNKDELMKFRFAPNGGMVAVIVPQFASGRVYVDASGFPLYGKVSEKTNSRYERLPFALKRTTRPDVWYLGQHSAGLYVRFRSNSPSIWARWKSTFGFSMDNMTDIGVRGLDLYTIEDGRWRFAGSARPGNGSVTDDCIVANMDGSEREYMLYLSLYDGVSSLEIGVDEGSFIAGPAVNSPSAEYPVVMYGTSILQGGCASRPGMGHTNIISRKLDREVINLGFSGNALLDLEIAELMASLETPSVYVLDYVPNASAELIEEKGEAFFRIIRDAHPEVPVIFVEDPRFPAVAFDSKLMEEVTRKNISQKRLFDKLKEQGEENIYYISSEAMLGYDGEATVDGIHLTDLGAMRYVELVLPVIQEAL